MLRPKCFLLVVMGIGFVQPPLQDANACSVPVFRYALERWKPDPYKGIFIHRGEITENDRALLRQLEEAGLNPDSPLNLRIREVNLATFSEEKLRELLKGPIPQKLPVLAIWYPEQMGKTAPLWTLELTPSIVKLLIDSPKRQQLAESLIRGESIVWIFIPSGDSEKDEKARALVRRELDLALSALAKMPFFILSGSKQKRLTYGLPILTLSRTDPAERFLLDTLLSSESDLREYKNEPMVFPVFGRGRALGCLFGEYITEKNIQDAVSFLAGSCNCEVKALNPGKDLLLAAQWDRVVMGGLFVDDDSELPELTGVMPGTSAAPEGTKKNTRVFTIYGITLGSILVVVVFAGLILSRRRRRDS